MMASVIASASIVAKTIVDLSICQYYMERSILSAQTSLAQTYGMQDAFQKSQFLRYKQDIMLRPLGLSVIGGTIVVTTQTLVQALSFLLSLFFLLLNMRSHLGEK